MNLSHNTPPHDSKSPQNFASEWSSASRSVSVPNDHASSVPPLSPFFATQDPPPPLAFLSENLSMFSSLANAASTAKVEWRGKEEREKDAYSEKMVESPPSSPSSSQHISGTGRRKRHRTTTEQRSQLELVFQRTPTPNQAVREQLASTLGMSPRRVQIWFQNKRAKARKSRAQSQHSALGISSSEMRPLTPPSVSSYSNLTPLTSQQLSSLVSVLPQNAQKQNQIQNSNGAIPQQNQVTQFPPQLYQFGTLPSLSTVTTFQTFPSLSPRPIVSPPAQYLRPPQGF
jgi:hypothetical protein